MCWSDWDHYCHISTNFGGDGYTKKKVTVKWKAKEKHTIHKQGSMLGTFRIFVENFGEVIETYHDKTLEKQWQAGTNSDI